jgi:hypothetical protein
MAWVARAIPVLLRVLLYGTRIWTKKLQTDEFP